MKRMKSTIPQLYQFKHRKNTLIVANTVLIILQIIAMGICFLYVCTNFVKWNLLNSEMKYISFLYRENFMNVLCFVLSIILFFPRPKKWTVQITALKKAIKYLEQANRLDFQENLIEKAKSFITDVDIVYEKKKVGEKNKIEPHENRMVMRRNLIILGIIGISALTLVLIFVFKWNIPQVASVDLIIGYGLVMYEAHYYQIVLKRSGISLMSEKYKDIVKEEEDNQQLYRFCQKICHMKADRYANYCLVLQIATSVTNIIAILITIMDNAGSADFKKLFALEFSNINAIVAAFFMVISIVLFFVGIYFENKIETEIMELKEYEMVKYTEKNYDYLVENVYNKTVGKNIFSRKALDFGRASYDFSNDMLVGVCIRQENCYVPISCMHTMRDSFPGRIPRYKLTAFIVWLCGFCSYVWGKANIGNIIPVTIFSLAVYCGLVIINAVKAWSEKQEWILFEKELQYKGLLTNNKSVKGDFLKFFLRNSIIMLFLIGISILNKTLSQNIIIISICVLAGTIVMGIIGEMLINRQKTIIVFEISRFWNTVILVLLGLLYSIVQYAFDKITIYECIVVIIIIPIFVHMVLCYCNYLDKKKSVTKLPAEVVFLIINWCNVFMMLFWSEHLQNRGIELVVIWLYVIYIALILGYTCYAALNREKVD